VKSYKKQILSLSVHIIEQNHRVSALLGTSCYLVDCFMAAKNFPVELQILPSEIIHDYSTHAVKVINARLIIPCLRDVPLQM